MGNYIVTWEIDEDDVANPVEAVLNVVNLLMDGNAPKEQVYKVLDKDTLKEYKVDMYNEDVEAVELIPGTYNELSAVERE